MIATRKMKPPITGRYVVSATQTRSGAGAEKSRWSRLGAMGSLWRESVVVRQRRFRRAASPWRTIEAATRFRLVRWPRRRSSRSMRGAPYRLFSSAKIAATRTSSCCWSSARREGPRVLNEWCPERESPSARHMSAFGY